MNKALPVDLKDKKFGQLCGEVASCVTCDRMKDSSRILGHSSGSLDAVIMFIGEAPGRLGADESGIPFHGDTAGHNFERFIDQVGISRYDIFITNAVLCNPKDEKGNNSTPSIQEVEKCARHLKQQIDLINPQIIVTLGSVSLKALTFIKAHDLSLKTAVRSSHEWYGRSLIPLYHPGQRALIHRSFANQLADYQFVAEQLRRIGKSQRKVTLTIREDIIPVIDIITALKPTLSYFGLHKLLYLIEYMSVRQSGKRLTSAYFIRQKDGPYCTDLHPQKLKSYFPDLNVITKNNHLFLQRNMPNLFDVSFDKKLEKLNEDSKSLIIRIIEKYGDLNVSDLKTKVYRYYKQTGKIRRFDKTARGAYKHWSLEDCIKSNDSPISSDASNNLLFLVGIRHEIEHQMTSRIDNALSAKFQACCLNYNTYIKKLFGEQYGIDKHLAFSLQFSSIHPTHIEQLNDALKLPSHIAKYITAFESPLTPEQLNSPEFAYRVFFVPKLSKSDGQADEVIQFVKADHTMTKEVNTIYFKDREKSKFLPNQIVEAMHREGYKKFRMHEHTLLWQSLNAKHPPKGYGVKVATVWYWYESWLEVVRKHCQDHEDQYKALAA